MPFRVFPSILRFMAYLLTIAPAQGVDSGNGPLGRPLKRPLSRPLGGLLGGGLGAPLGASLNRSPGRGLGGSLNSPWACAVSDRFQELL
jgi:hypothetical protein